MWGRARARQERQRQKQVGLINTAVLLSLSPLSMATAKSLEMFMQSILNATHKEAQATGQRKLTPAHLCVSFLLC